RSRVSSAVPPGEIRAQMSGADVRRQGFCRISLVPRNAEVIRQWTILREIERARGAGVTIDELASLCSVTTRTIRRDLQALEEAGFPLYDDRTHDDGKTRWQVNGQAFKGLSAGLTVSELCALYFSRTLLES